MRRPTNRSKGARVFDCSDLEDLHLLWNLNFSFSNASSSTAESFQFLDIQRHDALLNGQGGPSKT